MKAQKLKALLIVNRRTVILGLIGVIILCILPFFKKEAAKHEKEKAPKTTQMSFQNSIWISMYDMEFENLTYTEFKEKADKMMEEIYKAGFDNIIVQVRANCDALYKSDIFPMSAVMSGKQGTEIDFDPLEYLILSAHKQSLTFEAWINPYRVSTTNDISKISEKSPAFPWLNDGSGRAFIGSEENGVSGIYLNPASEKARELIVNGVKEILNNYKVDGIQFDDYFYPTENETFDKAAYEQYTASASSPLPLAEWRRANVNAMISAVYSVVKSYDNVIFGISPAADIEKNYNSYYADIEEWLMGSYCDYIAPQLYFGMEYPQSDFAFKNILKKWTNLPKSKNVKLYIGLAAYKIGKEDCESTEWIDSDSVLSDEYKTIIDKKTDGAIIYSYSSFFSNEDLNNIERANYIKEMNNLKSKSKK